MTGTGIGLTGEYFANASLSGSPVTTRQDATVNFAFGGANPPPPGIAAGTDYSVRWTGHFTPRFSETYTLELNADDGATLKIDGASLISQFGGIGDFTGTINLVAGQSYAVEITFYGNGDGDIIQWFWQSASQPREIVPALATGSGTAIATPTLTATPVLINNVPTILLSGH